MSDFYQPLRDVHITSVVVSFLLLVARHVMNLRQVDWRKWKALRILPHVVDTVLLASAIWLTIEIHQYPIVNGWLTVKVIALVIYIGLAMQALNVTRSQSTRRFMFLAAVAVFAFIVTVARTHSPLGVFSSFL
jgi:uncharacterized membrane protein SirB2